MVTGTLKEYAAEAQKGIRAFLTDKMASKSSSDSFEVAPLWITNKVIVRGADRDLLEELSAHEDITQIEPDKYIQVDDHVVNSGSSAQIGQTNLSESQKSWGIDKIQAPSVWKDQGKTGEGIVVAIIDSGVRGTHEAIAKAYRKPHGWFDPIDSEPEPVDHDGHGTHCTGTIVGQNGIGVAPGSQWIGCKVQANSGGGFPNSALYQCGQWANCPDNDTCASAPHVVSNSWGGGGGEEDYDDVIRAWRASAIIPIFAVGNSGLDGCGTAASPADNPQVIAVGCTDSEDRLNDQSSTGPGKRGNYLKPEVSAPGIAIISASYESDSGYMEKSGTSMACPHVAGLVALMLSKNPELTFDQVREALAAGAEFPLKSGKTCGGTNSNDRPNWLSGYGRINAVKTFQALP